MHHALRWELEPRGCSQVFACLRNVVRYVSHPCSFCCDNPDKALVATSVVQTFTRQLDSRSSRTRSELPIAPCIPMSPRRTRVSESSVYRCGTDVSTQKGCETLGDTAGTSLVSEIDSHRDEHHRTNETAHLSKSSPYKLERVVQQEFWEGCQRGAGPWS